MTPRVRHIILALMCAAALVWAAVGYARADGVLSADEAYVVADAGADICVILDRLGVESGAAVTVAMIVSKGIPADSAADIVNASVLQFCPRHWDALVAIGDAARSRHKGPLI